jgi:hypothetical protein
MERPLPPSMAEVETPGAAVAAVPRPLALTESFSEELLQPARRAAAAMEYQVFVRIFVSPLRASPSGPPRRVVPCLQ